MLPPGEYKRGVGDSAFCEITLVVVMIKPVVLLSGELVWWWWWL